MPDPTPSLDEFLKAIRRWQPTVAQRRDQRVSFAYGNCHLDNENVTREMVEKADRRLHPEDYSDEPA